MSEPLVTIGPRSIRVRGYEFPDRVDFWGGNLLAVEAECAGMGSRVCVGDALSRSTDLLKFAGQCEVLHAS